MDQTIRHPQKIGSHERNLPQNPHSSRILKGSFPLACGYEEIISGVENLASEGGRGGREGGVRCGSFFVGASILGRWWFRCERERRQVSSPVEDDVVSVGVEPEQMDKQSSSRIKTLPL